MIPLILFKKTSGMFSKWLKNLIGFSLQPMILAAYVSISVMIIDNYSTGEALFVGQGLDNRELVCGYACKSATTGEILSYTTKRSYTASVALRILDNFKDKSEDYVVNSSEIAEDAELKEFIQYLAASVVESIIKDIKEKNAYPIASLIKKSKVTSKYIEEEIINVHPMNIDEVEW